ncbi:MAG: hypothetical protein HXY34_02360 [Candidatus Thorarchaeota archaeon]|nr:hypothetical protein [Candidatus Thorarchaeota archaeon]
MTWLPVGILVLESAGGVQESYSYDFSIYNEEWNGLSDFRVQIESTGRETMSIQSVVSVVTRLRGQAILVIMGPVKDFSAEAAFVFWDHLSQGGGLLIADDFGTANSSLAILNLLLAGSLGGSGLPIESLVSFTGGVLLDLDSYDTSPKLPVITRFTPGLDGGALTQGVTSLHLNWATALSPRSAMGFAGVAWTTQRAWCDTNISDPSPYPDENEWSGSLPVAGAIDLDLLLQGEETLGRMVAVSDPSLFINDMLGRGSNSVFAANVVNWLSRGNSSLPVVFCETLLPVPFTSAEFMYGVYLGRVLFFATLPFFYVVAPLFTVVGLRRYIPDPKKPEVKSMSEVFLRKGQTYFSERMAYYRSVGNYARVVKMLYRKLVRDLKKTYGWADYDPRRLWSILSSRERTLREDDFHRTIKRIEEISARPFMKIKENEMMNLFFFIRNIQSLLVESKT